MTYPDNPFPEDSQVDDGFADQVMETVAGTKLVTRPGLVTALLKAKATPQQARAIDQFYTGLQAAKDVQAARLSGAKLRLSPDERLMLEFMGVNYGTVEQTYNDDLNDFAKEYETQTGQKAQRDARGVVVLDANGQIVPEAKKPKGEPSGWKGVLYDVTHNAATDLIEPLNLDVAGEKALHGLTRMGNTVLGTLGDASENTRNFQSGNIEAVSNAMESRRKEMEAAGYEGDFFGYMAFLSSGKSHADVSDLEQKYSPELIQQIREYTANSEKFMSSLDDETLKAFVQNPNLEIAMKEYAGRRNSVGASFARDLGIDPVKNSTKFTLTALTFDLAALIATDPINAAFTTLSATRRAQLAINGLADTNSVERILTTSKGMYAKRMQDSLGRMVGYADEIRAAEQSGDFAKAAGISHKAHVENPALAQLLPDFIGANQLVGKEAGKYRQVATGDAITTYDDAVKYITSKVAMARLYGGRAATEAAVMPGAVSAHGYRRLKGIVGGWQAERSAERALALAEKAKATRTAPGAGTAARSAALNQALQQHDEAIATAERLSERFAPMLEDAIAHGERVSSLEYHMAQFAKTKAAKTPNGKKAMAKFRSRLEALRAEEAVNDAAVNIGGKTVRDAKAVAQARIDALKDPANYMRFGDEAVPVDPGRLGDLIFKADDYLRVMPMADDAINAATGRILAAESAVKAAKRDLGVAKSAAGRAKKPESVAAAQARLTERQAAYDSATSGLASARRAKEEAELAKGALRSDYEDLAKFTAANATGDELGKAAFEARRGFGAHAQAERARIAMARFYNFLPRNTSIHLTDANGADIVFKIARTYLTKGDAAMLRAAYVSGDVATRKAVLSGMIDQLGHASGLARSEAGQKVLAALKTQTQRYSSTGDEIVLANGDNVALNPGQITDVITLPNFQLLHKFAAKVGIYEATLGRGLTSQPADILTQMWKAGVLAQPRTAYRAALESWVNLATNGGFMAGVRAKALLREHELAKAAEAGGQIAKGSHRLGLLERAAQLAPLAAVGRFYRQNITKGIPKNVQDEIAADLEAVWGEAVHRYAILNVLDDIDPAGLQQMDDIVRNGFKPTRNVLNWTKDPNWGKSRQVRTDFALLDTNYERYHAALRTRVDAVPDLARVAARALEEGDPNAVKAIVNVMDNSPGIRPLSSQMGWGHHYWKPDNAEAFPAVTPEQIALGKEQWAGRILNDYKFMFTGTNGKLNTKLTGYVAEHGKAPEALWLTDNVKDMASLPKAVLAPQFEALTQQGGTAAFANAVLQAEGKGYQWLVERPLVRTTIKPIFFAAYGEEKVALLGHRAALEAQGLTAEAANNVVREMAMMNAWERVALMVDDPQLKSQLDIVGRNFFAFSRATTTMIRRWGTTFYRNPAQARRMQLAAEASVHSGFVYEDENGHKMFAYPASGAMIDALKRVAEVTPLFDGLAGVPTADLTGRADQIVPGLSNPFQYSMSPMVALPMRKIAEVFPETQMIWNELDDLINGEASRNRELTDAVTPSLARYALDALSQDERDSLLASATIGTLANLANAGQLPGPNASPDEVEQFLGRVKDGTRSALFVRAIMQPFLLAPPKNIEGAQQKADYAYAVRGAKSLQAEYKMILNDVGGDVGRAQTIFAALHPDGLAYTVPKSKSLHSGAELPATEQAWRWLDGNRDFIEQYESVAAYFVPVSAERDAYSARAYQAQLEYGFRQKKSPWEFYREIRIRGAEDMYYTSRDDYLAKVEAAELAGDKARKAELNAKWDAYKKWLLDQNPLLSEKFAENNYAKAVVDAKGKVESLKTMIANGAVPKVDGTDHTPALSAMVREWEGYAEFLRTHTGDDTVSKAWRQSAQAHFVEKMQSYVRGDRQLRDIYNGIFRALERDLPRLEWD